MSVGLKDLRPGDFVRAETGRDAGRHFLIDNVYPESGTLSITPATKAGRIDRRFYVGWSGYYANDEWTVLARKSLSC